jgi:hypothetical protein
MILVIPVWCLADKIIYADLRVREVSQQATENDKPPSFLFLAYSQSEVHNIYGAVCLSKGISKTESKVLLFEVTTLLRIKEY